MALELEKPLTGKVLTVRVSGKLTTGDYERFVPEVEALIRQHGKMRVLFEMHDFHGWKAGALWEDLKFGLEHFRDIERLAMVGEAAWEKGMSVFCKPFTTAKIRYFDRGRRDEATEWLQED